jgi:hypothetical protein
MSYRTCVNGEQIFGNGEYYHEWIEFIKSQGIEVDEDGCYEGEIVDFMGALVTIENIVMRLNKEREERKIEFDGKTRMPIESLFDFSNIPQKIADPKYETSLLDELHQLIENSYAFMPYVFYQACEEQLTQDHIYTTPNHFFCYKLNDGEKIHVRAR